MIKDGQGILILVCLSICQNNVSPSLKNFIKDYIPQTVSKVVIRAT